MRDVIYIVGLFVILSNIPFGIWTCVATVVYTVLFLFIENAMAYKRAMGRRPTGYKHGMYVDLKTNELVGIQTAVHTDHITGRQFFGKCIKGEHHD